MNYKTCLIVRMLFYAICCNIIWFCRAKRTHFHKKSNGNRHLLAEELKDQENEKFFKEFRRTNEIYNFMKRLARSNPSIANIVSIGKTVEGRDLKLIQIGSRNSYSKPGIWIDGGIHAREWLSPATVTYIIYKLFRDYKKEKDLINSFHWYVLPVMNPDGYEYSHEHNRMWRKNRNPSNSKCPGVDLNRNWGFHWNEGGASSNPCSELFAGKTAFSEPETKAISNFIQKKHKKQKFVAYVSFHAYGQMWFTPWGWTRKLPKDYADLKRVAEKAVKAIRKVNGTSYKVLTSSNVFGIAAGGSEDWAHAVAGIKYSYAVELPDEGEHGFTIPKGHILVVGKEIWEAIKAMAREIRKQKRT